MSRPHIDNLIVTHEKLVCVICVLSGTESSTSKDLLRDLHSLERGVPEQRPLACLAEPKR